MQPHLAIMKITIQLKLLILAFALVSLMMIFSNDVMPNVGKLTVFAYAIGGLLVLATSLLAVIFIIANINQIILNHGGVDTAWLWFSRNPQGLDRAQAQAQANKE